MIGHLSDVKCVWSGFYVKITKIDVPALLCETKLETDRREFPHTQKNSKGNEKLLKVTSFVRCLIKSSLWLTCLPTIVCFSACSTNLNVIYLASHSPA